MTFVTDGHLGGYVEGGDPDTWYPNLWAWFLDTLGIDSVLDVGCGDGAALRWWGSEVARAEGVDGVDQGGYPIFTHDYTTGPWQSGYTYGLVWSCEFVEHVEERFVDNFLETFKAGRYVAMTHAQPGQPGWHHVNCQPSDYWVRALDAIGYDLLEDTTAIARAVAATDEAPINYFKQTGLVFGRKGT